MKKLILALMLVSLLPLTAFAAADKTEPSDVDNIKGVAMDKAVHLTWDAATDNVAIKGYQVHYGLNSVSETGQTYDHVVDAGNVLEYTVTGLENDKKYYLTVIAYDAAENESVNWGTPEVAITPSADATGEADKTAPQVSKSEAINKVEVKITFSEAVVLPEEDPQDAFGVENDDTFEPLAVTKAELDKEDKTEKTVILTTDPQTKGTKYKLTVGIDIQDKAGNPIISGTSDTALFTGTDVEKVVADKNGPEVVDVKVVDNTHLVVNFNETVVLSIDPSENFNILEEDDATKTLSILGVELKAGEQNAEDASALITTSPQSDKNYVVVASGLKDEAGNEVNPAKGSAVFKGVATGGTNIGEEDKTPPKDVAKLIAKAVYEAGKSAISLKWDIPKENIDDLASQLIYLSLDKGKKYDKKTDLDPLTNAYKVKDLQPGEYWVKLTQKDEAGNESTGTIAKVVLTKSGPELLGLVLLSLGLGKLVTRRKK